MALYFSWGLAGAKAVLVAVWHVMVKCVLSLHQDTNQNIKLSKNQKYP